MKIIFQVNTQSIVLVQSHQRKYATALNCWRKRFELYGAEVFPQKFIIGEENRNKMTLWIFHNFGI